MDVVIQEIFALSLLLYILKLQIYRINVNWFQKYEDLSMKREIILI